MAIITLRIPDELKTQMDLLDEVNWSAVARNLLKKKVEEYHILEKIKEAEKDIKTGRTIPHEEVFKKYKDGIKKYSLD